MLLHKRLTKLCYRHLIGSVEEIQSLPEKYHVLEIRRNKLNSDISRKGYLLETLSSLNNKLHVLKVLKMLTFAKDAQKVSTHTLFQDMSGPIGCNSIIPQTQ
jgi:hypothetical protein